ncbi:MAG TPA: selenium cofactor biosynthesis protein YqeC [Aggregatilinea sp.]|uniref:selenium cofactor biosynthesis protein YqeC n=1 Tax=Aggregatilinea sp. TaxID=2806333 RepID=UPI002B608306|nr:selenium cofactor biosynthesis protein YqeC [Aggregatilinea sp.]HML24376.1 selenium cofactor biosynthesis protein YqeC [Aggregatilinea sp.]
MRLKEALRVQRGDVVAFVGAGGKTSALFRLARELHEDGWRVLATTTTRIAREEVKAAPLAVQLTANVTPEMIRQWLTQHGFVFLYGSDNRRKGRIAGLHPDVIPGLLDTVDSDVILIEADGARRLSFKVPYDHEPVLPSDTSLVVPVAGIDALGQPLDEQHVYNATRIQERYGFPDGEPLIPPWMAVAIRDSELGLRNIPENMRIVPLLNKVPASGLTRTRARRVAQLVLRSERVEAVVMGEMKGKAEPVHEVQRRVAAVVLAAGLSTRMGRSKALLPWDNNRTVIEAVVSRLITARIQDVVVVTGFQAEGVAQALLRQPVVTVHNPRYAEGEMLSSLQAGLNALPASVSACLVVLGDQPTLDPRVILKVLAAYSEGKGEIVVPEYRGDRGHPILIGRRFWPEILALESGAPRDVIRQHPDVTAHLEVNTDSILRDIDTPEQYYLERRRAGLR